MPKRQGMIARRRALGHSQEHLAEILGVNPATVGRWERGQSLPQGRQLNGLADALQVNLNQLHHLLDGEADRGLPAINGVSVPHLATHYAALERAASQIDLVHQSMVPGLLQTRDYMMVVMRDHFEPRSDQRVTGLVSGRLARQEVLARTDPLLKQRYVIDESALHRFGGPAEIMVDQLDHLAALARRPAIEIRIMPIRSSAFFAGDFPFTLFYGPGAKVPFLVATEDIAGAQYRDTVDVVREYLLLFEYLWYHALSSRASMELLVSARKEFS